MRVYMLCLLLLIPNAWGNESAVPDTNGELRVGLVLAGGGARGIAHVGVIKALEEMQIPVHAVAGTSMGALVGGIRAGVNDMRYGLIAIASLFLLGVDARAGESPRRTVALLSFENKTGDPQLDFWRHAPVRLLETDLRQVRAVRLLAREGAGSFKLDPNRRGARRIPRAFLARVLAEAAE